MVSREATRAIERQEARMRVTIQRVVRSPRPASTDARLARVYETLGATGPLSPSSLRKEGLSLVECIRVVVRYLLKERRVRDTNLDSIVIRIDDM